MRRFKPEILGKKSASVEGSVGDHRAYSGVMSS